MTGERIGFGLLVLLWTTVCAQDRLDCSDERAKAPVRIYEYVITCDKPDGIYAVGETATLKVRVRNQDGSTPTEGCVRFELDGYDNRTFHQETHDMAKEGNVLTVRGTLDHPGFLRFKIFAGDSQKFGIWCVAVAPDEIMPGVDDPPDFDVFWANASVKYEREVPFDIELHLDADQTTPWNDVYRLSFTAPDRTKLHGFISYPKDRSRKYPARFEVPSAGVGDWTRGPSTYQRDRCVNMLLNVFPFEVPKSPESARIEFEKYCKRLKDELGSTDYVAAGLGVSREKATLYNYFLGAKRAVDWLSRQPEVDASHLVYWGASQGGGFGTGVVALSGRFSKAVLLVPSLVDDMGRFNRCCGGPADMIHSQLGEKAQNIARLNWPYFSAENFARRIRCPVMVSVGFCDPTCPPHGGWSIYNLIPGASKCIVGAVNQPHGPPDPVWFGSSQWLLDDPGWKWTFGPQYLYVHGSGFDQ